MPAESSNIKPCPSCGKPMAAARGVCPECGHMTGWFQARLYLGCAGIAIGFIVIVATLVMAVFFSQPGP